MLLFLEICIQHQKYIFNLRLLHKDYIMANE